MPYHETTTQYTNMLSSWQSDTNFQVFKNKPDMIRKNILSDLRTNALLLELYENVFGRN